MKLYHGTSTAHVSGILKDGIKPRQITGLDNFRGTVPSSERNVYLTDSYPLYYAFNAIGATDWDEHVHLRRRERLAIIEVDTDLLQQVRLGSDEEASERSGRGRDGIDGTFAERTAFYREHTTQFSWFGSLNQLGNCSYRGTIPSNAITRVAYIDVILQNDLIWFALCADISVDSHEHAGGLYRAMTNWIFDEPVTYADAVLFDRVMMIDGEMKRIYRWPPSPNRNGINLVHVSELLLKTA